MHSNATTPRHPENLSAAGTVDPNDVVSHLNQLLRGERSAVETYRQAIEKFRTGNVRGVDLLEQLMASHQVRVRVLSDEVRRLGGEPDDSSGAWGAFAKLVQGTADLFGEKSAIAALEEGEDHGLSEYQKLVQKVDASTRQWIQAHIYPEQRKTHDALRGFQKQLNASS